MLEISDFLSEAQEAVDSMLILQLRNDVQAVVQAQRKFQEDILASARTASIAVESTKKFAHEIEAAQQLAQKFAPEFDAAQRLARELAPAFEAVQKLAQELAPALEAAQKLARKQEALLAFPAVATVQPSSKLDWSVISPRPRFGMAFFDPEPCNERTIVRREVKRKIGFRP